MKDPFFIQWHITNFCNLRCQHCYQEDFSKDRDLDWFGLKKISQNILTTINEWNKKANINLTGGEPLLKPELFPLLHDLNKEPMVRDLGIITNGLLFNQEVIKRLAGFSKLKKIKISLDGANAEIHDSFRAQGSFEKVMKGLSLIKYQGRFQVILMFTVMKINVKYLLSLLKLCEDLNIEGLIVERFIPWGKGREILEEVLDQDQWKEMVKTLLDSFSIEMENHPPIPYQAFQISFHKGGQDLSGAPCVIGADGLCIMPEGSVFPCRRFPVAIGNLLEDSLKTIWATSELLEKLRRKENLKGKCGRCRVKDCRGCRSLALCLTGDTFAEDPHCWYEIK